MNRLWALLVCASLFSFNLGCGGGSENTLTPAGSGAGDAEKKFNEDYGKKMQEAMQKQQEQQSGGAAESN